MKLEKNLILGIEKCFAFKKINGCLGHRKKFAFLNVTTSDLGFF